MVNKENIMEAFLLSLSFMVTPIATQYDSVNPNASYQAIDVKSMICLMAGLTVALSSLG